MTLHAATGEEGHEKRREVKTSKIQRIRKRLRITIDPENYEYLKESGINASRSFVKVIFERLKVNSRILALISQNRWNNGLFEIRTRDLRCVKAVLPPILHTSQ